MRLKLLRKSATTWVYIFTFEGGSVLTWHQGGKAFWMCGDEVIAILHNARIQEALNFCLLQSSAA